MGKTKMAEVRMSTPKIQQRPQRSGAGTKKSDGVASYESAPSPGLGPPRRAEIRWGGGGRPGS
jgi:hypothetical protein